MNGQAADRDPHRPRRERLDLELPEARSVECVCDVRSESVEIEVFGAAADLLVDSERNSDRCPRALGMTCEVRDGGHDLRDPRLVVRAEQRRPVARNDVVADALRKLRKLLGIEHLPRVTRKLDRLASPTRVDDRPDTGSYDV